MYFRSRLAFRVHVAGDLNKAISFVVAVLSTSFVRSRFARAHPSEPELPYAIKYFLIIIYIGLYVF